MKRKFSKKEKHGVGGLRNGGLGHINQKCNFDEIMYISISALMIADHIVLCKCARDEDAIVTGTPRLRRMQGLWGYNRATCETGVEVETGLNRG